MPNWKKNIFIIILIIILLFSKSEIYSFPRDSVINSKNINKYLLANINYDQAINENYSYKEQGFNIIKFQYYVIFSNLSEEKNYSIITNEIYPLIYSMYDNFFNTLPSNNPISIFIFDNSNEYRNALIENFDESTYEEISYGIFERDRNVIFVRYFSGSSSLSHEVIHSLINIDFPNAPVWLDEGMASFLEKFSLNKKGEIWGFNNWGYRILKEFFVKDNYSNLEYLMNIMEEDFYGLNSLFYYAQSQQLLKYLQYKGFLKQYYSNFRDSYEFDETGITQLEKILNKPLREIEIDFLKYLELL